ncbi:hypothetical protein NE865_08043 [Phthorimaea operculella]|nr:hypothetical protein NE865_08043 [Phthorimaea operculella]
MRRDAHDDICLSDKQSSAVIDATCVSRVSFFTFRVKIEKSERLSQICLNKILKYFGHIARRSEDSLERLMVTGKVKGKRPRGHSPKRWSDQISEQLDIPVSVALHLATHPNR